MRSLRTTAWVVALALGTAALPARAADTDKFLHDDTEAVITFNVRQFLDSPFVKRFGLDKMLAGDATAKNMLTELGLDPLKDVRRIVAGMGKGDATEVIIVEGDFDPAKLKAKAEAAAKEKPEHVKLHQAAGGTVYELANLDKLVKLPAQAEAANLSLKDKPGFAVIPDKNHILITSSKAGAAALLDRASGKTAAALKSKELVGLLSKADPTQTLSMAMTGTSTQTEKVRNITGGLTFTDGVKLDLAMATPDEASAKEIDDVMKEQLDTIKGLAGALAQQPGNQGLASVVDLLGNIKHGAQEKAVTVKTEIKGDVLEKLLKELAKMAQQQEQQP